MKPDNLEALGKAYDRLATYFRAVPATMHHLPVPPFVEIVPMGPELRKRRKLSGKEYRVARKGPEAHPDFFKVLIWEPHDITLEPPTFEEWVAAYRRDPDIYESMPAEKYLTKKGKIHGTIYQTEDGEPIAE